MKYQQVHSFISFTLFLWGFFFGGGCFSVHLKVTSYEVVAKRLCYVMLCHIIINVSQDLSWKLSDLGMVLGLEYRRHAHYVIYIWHIMHVLGGF